MALVTANYLKALARNDAARADAQMANAFGMFALSRATSDGGIGIGTTVAKARSNATITSLINGVFYSKGSTDDLWTLSGSVVAVSSWQKYLLLLDTSGNASVQEGVASTVSAADVKWTNISNISPWAPFLTVVGETKFIAGVLTVATNASTTFTPGTTGLDAAGITDTYIDGIDQSILPLLGNAQGTIYGLT